MFNVVCRITCRETLGFGLQIQVLFSTTRFNIILPFKYNSFQLSLTITSSNTNFLYISRYKVGDHTDHPSSKLPPSLEKGLQYGRLNETFVVGPSLPLHSVYRIDAPLPSRDRILYICEQIYLPNFLRHAAQSPFFSPVSIKCRLFHNVIFSGS
jgi:hypothetical protein